MEQPATNLVADYLHSLNEGQLKVALAGPGRYALAGGPGSGKTRAIIALIARVVSGGYPPNQVLAMTFTRDAAGEMNRRLQSLGISGARVGTIHSLCHDIIGRETNLLSTYTVDQRGRLGYELKRQLSEFRRRRKLPRLGVDKEGVARFVESCKARGICHIEGDPFLLNEHSADHIQREAQHWSTLAGVPPDVLFEFYHAMEERRDQAHLLDFDDMLQWAWLTLIADPDTLDHWRNQWGLIIVDETQDSNPVQWDIAQLLAGMGTSIPQVELLDEPPCARDQPSTLIVAGDPSQSIYGWRSAAPEQFVNFATSEGVEMFQLPVNYRATQDLCSAATHLVKSYKWHLVGDIVSALPKRSREHGLRLETAPSPEVEISGAVLSARELGVGNCAVLARLSVSLHIAEIECIRKRIKYVKRSSGSFLEATEVKTLLAYLRVAGGFDLDGSALRFIINRPYRYLSNQLITKCEAESRVRNISLLDVLMDTRMSFAQKRGVRELYSILCNLSVMAQQAATTEGGIAGQPGKMMATVLRETKLLDVIKREEGLVTQDDSKVVLLAELQRVGELFNTVSEFIGYMDALAVAVKQARRQGLRVEEGSDALTLSTIHRAKGLEWDHVKVIDTVKGRFPCSRAESYEEELRLLYVAVTRARNSCTVSFSGEPSDFIDRLSQALEGGCDDDSTTATD